MMKNNMIRKGVWIADKRGTYVIADMEDRYIFIQDVLRTSKGKIIYGKRRVIGVNDLDNYVVV